MPNSEFIKAELLRSGQRLATKFQVTVVEPNTDDWHGEFFTSETLQRGEYQLVSEDGREAAILVTHVHPDENGSCRCEFKGIGRFGR